MELREYLAIIGKRSWLFITVILLITMGTYLFTVSQPKSYDASSFVNVVVKQSTEQKPDYYDYDNYYSLQASSLFADTIIAWLKDPSNVIKIYNQAQIERPDIKLNNFSRLIKTRKNNPATVQVMFNHKDKLIAESLINTTVKFIEDKTNQWAQQDLIKDVYIDNSQPIVIEYKPSVLLNTVIGFVAGIVLGLALVFFVEYLKKPGEGK